MHDAVVTCQDHHGTGNKCAGGHGGGPGPKPIVNRDELTSDDDDVPPDVTHELNRLKALGRPYQAPSASELLPKGDVHGTRFNELLHPCLVDEGRAVELTTLCGQDALFVMP